MKVITTAQLETLINDTVKGNTFVSIISETDPKMVKKHRETGEPNPYIGAIKTQKKNGQIGFDYQNNVNAQAERENKEEREAQPRKWGVLSDNRLFVHHKGQSYLQLRLNTTGDTYYTLNGETIPTEQIQPFLPIKNASSTQADLDKQIIINDIKLSNIKAITINKETYAIAPTNMTGKTAQGKTAQPQPQPQTATTKQAVTN